MEFVLALIAGLVVGGLLGLFGLIAYQSNKGGSRIQQAEEEAKERLASADREAKDLLREARQELQTEQQEVERTLTKRRTELEHEEERLNRRRDDLDRRFDRIEQREKDLNKRQSRIDKRQNEIEQRWLDQEEAIARIAEMTRDEAREHLLRQIETETRHEMARVVREIEAEAQANAEDRARDIVAIAIQRLASEHVNEISVSVVPLPSDDMKGRIIGRAGRNIRSFEQATGVDVIVDDTPEAVTISSFDPVRREIAKRALSKLVLDGRIHPARIEKLVEDTGKEVDRIIKDEGERAAYEAGVPGLHAKIIEMLGRLKFRTSYGQNMHSHSIETSHLAGLIAAELGADVTVAKAGGLLHDIGKAIDHEVEGPHALIGAEYCERFGVGGKIVNCIASHHHEVAQDCIEAIIVEAADAISGARPGARRESLDAYIKRVRTLEDIANSFEGVHQSYALQAGREVRILVRPEEVDDLAAIQLSRDISRKIEETMQYPGQIKVTIIRETRAVEYAK